MEDSLWLPGSFAEAATTPTVLILILMEDSLCPCQPYTSHN